MCSHFVKESVKALFIKKSYCGTLFCGRNTTDHVSYDGISFL